MTRILVTGRTGQVGWELERMLPAIGEVLALDRRAIDLSSPDSVRDALRAARPDIIVNAAGYTNVDRAEDEPALARQVNAVAPGIMAEEARRTGALLVHYSTDYVFDGVLDRPYVEEDATEPVNEYGRAKLEGERAIEAVGGAYAILRTSWIYSARGSNFVLTILRLARERPELTVVNDQVGSPTWARALAQATADLLRRRADFAGRSGIYHLSAMGHASRYEFATAIVRTMQELSGASAGWSAVKPITSDEYPLRAARPPHPVTAKDKIRNAFGLEMPDWESQLRSCLTELAAGADWRGLRS